MSEWIKPEDKLPRPMTNVLVYQKWWNSMERRYIKTYEIGLCDSDGCWGGGAYGGEVIAWTELPDPPKEE